jgi:hypothetical protein
MINLFFELFFLGKSAKETPKDIFICSALKIDHRLIIFLDVEALETYIIFISIIGDFDTSTPLSNQLSHRYRQSTFQALCHK